MNNKASIVTQKVNFGDEQLDKFYHMNHNLSSRPMMPGPVIRANRNASHKMSGSRLPGMNMGLAR